MKKKEFFAELSRSALSGESSDQDVLACMVVFHTHCFRPKRDIFLDDAGESDVLAPLTRRHASEIVAGVMSEIGGNSEPGYWYHAYDRQCPFEVADDIPDKWMELVGAVVERMKKTVLDDVFPDE